jgi:TP901 family phage tail tape measure protein
VGFKLAELFVPIRIDMNPLSKGLALAHRGLLGLTAAAASTQVSLRGAFLGLAGVGAPVAYAVKQAIDLEHAYGQIRKTTGLAGEEFDRLKKGLQGLATSMAGVSLDEVNGIAEMAGRLGITGVDGILSYTKAIASIKIALDDIPAEEAATSIARILNVFHLGPDAALSFASALNKLDDSSTATGRDILDVAQRLSGSAATLGLSPQKVLALAAALKDAGVENEVAGSAFSQILGKMATDTKAFARVSGVSTAAFAAALRKDPLEAIKLLVGGLKGMEKLERFKALDKLGLDGVRTSGALLQLSAVFGKLDGLVGDAESEWVTHASIQKEVAIRAEETGAQLTLLWNNVRLTAAGIGDLLLPVIKRLADVFGEVATAVGASVESQRAAIAPWVQWLLDSIDSVALVWRNWGDIVALTGVSIMGEIDHIQAVLGAFLNWVGANWATIFLDAFETVGTALDNLGKNFVDFAAAVAAWAFGGADFEFRFTPVLAGLHLDTPELELPDRDPEFERQRQEILDRMADRERERLDARARRGAEAAAGGPAETPKPDDATGKAPEKKAKKETATTEDLAAYIRRLGESAFKKDDTAKLVDLSTEMLAVDREALALARRPPRPMPGVAAGPA